MDFVALDFETANNRSDSACQLALVVVRNHEIVDEYCWLIRPPRLYFSPRNISIHGIRAEHVARAPTMQTLWPQLQPLLDGQILVAHNAGFDIGVLVASLAAFDIACPMLEFSCTRAIARRAWPGRSRYGLKPLGDWLGIDFKHHDALEDARCCAHIALSAAGASAYPSFAEFEKALRLSRGRYCLGQVRNPRRIGSGSFIPPTQPRFFEESVAPNNPTETATSSFKSPLLKSPSLRQFDPAPPEIQFSKSRTPGRGGIDPVTILEAAAGSQPLANKRIVCLGALRGLTEDDTQKLISALGGYSDKKITAETDYVVACGGVMLADAKEILDREVESAPVIRVLSERQFLSLLPGGKSAVRW